MLMSGGFEVPTTEIVQALLQDLSFEFKDQGRLPAQGHLPQLRQARTVHQEGTLHGW